MTLPRRAGVALALLAACGPGPIDGVKTDQVALVTAPRVTVQTARLGLAVSAAAAANFKGVIYVAGGLKGGGVAAFDEYTRLVTEGGAGDVDVALEAYRRAKERLTELEGR